MTKGGRNLVIMGVAAGVIALVTTYVALAIYHNTGDIYLDRSRPGYLPDEEELEGEEDLPEAYEFPKNGAVTDEVLKEYLEHLDEEIRAIDAYGETFDKKALDFSFNF